MRVPAAPLPVSKVVAAPSEIAPKSIAVFVVFIVPYVVLKEFAVATKPPVNVKLPPAAPSESVPVFEKVTAFVMAPVDPLKAKLYPALAVLRVVAVKAPVNVIVPVVAVRVTVAASTVLEKVVPPEFVIVIVPKAVLAPTAPVTAMTPAPAVRVSVLAPLIVDVNDILPSLTESSVFTVISVPRVTGPVSVILPAVVPATVSREPLSVIVGLPPAVVTAMAPLETDTALIATSSASLMVNPASGADPPTAPDIVTSAVPASIERV